MFVQRITNTIKLFASKLVPQTDKSYYRPTPYLNHHILQSAYELLSSDIHIPFKREKVFF